MTLRSPGFRTVRETLPPLGTPGLWVSVGAARTDGRRPRFPPTAGWWRKVGCTPRIDALWLLHVTAANEFLD